MTGGAIAGAALVTAPAWVVVGGVVIAGAALDYAGAKLGSWLGGAIGRIWDSPVVEAPNIAPPAPEERIGPMVQTAHEVMPPTPAPEPTGSRRAR